jgi:hypothetical protein
MGFAAHSLAIKATDCLKRKVSIMNENFNEASK